MPAYPQSIRLYQDVLLWADDKERCNSHFCLFRYSPRSSTVHRVLLLVTARTLVTTTDPIQWVQGDILISTQLDIGILSGKRC